MSYLQPLQFYSIEQEVRDDYATNAETNIKHLSDEKEVIEYMGRALSGNLNTVDREISVKRIYKIDLAKRTVQELIPVLHNFKLALEIVPEAAPS